MNETNALLVNLLTEYIIFLDKKNIKIASLDIPNEIQDKFVYQLKNKNFDVKLFYLENTNIPNSLNERIKKNNIEVEIGKTICTW